MCGQTYVLCFKLLDLIVYPGYSVLLFSLAVFMISFSVAHNTIFFLLADPNYVTCLKQNQHLRVRMLAHSCTSVMVQSTFTRTVIIINTIIIK